MIKVEFGKIEMDGDYGDLLADVMTMCDVFIKKTMDEFEIREAKAINAFTKMTEIVKDHFHELDEEKSMKQISELFDYLTEDRERKKTSMVVIEADSPEDALKQAEEILRELVGKEGDE